MFLRGTYEPIETGLFAASVPAGGVVFDAGTNVGVYTVIAAARVGPTDRVACVKKAVSDSSVARELIHHDENLGLHSFVAADAHTGGHWDSLVTVETVLLDEVVAAERVYVDVLKMDVQGAQGLAVAGAARLLALWATGSVSCVCALAWPPAPDWSST